MTAGFSIDRAEAVLVVVDVQERLAAVMDQRQKVIANCRPLVDGAPNLGVPAIVPAPYPKGPGPTEEALRGALSSSPPIAKPSFSCCGQPAFTHRPRALARMQALRGGRAPPARLPPPRHHGRRALGQPRRLGGPCEGQGGQAGLLRRCQHAGIAHRQRRPHRTPDDLHRIVPRGDMSGDAMLLAKGIDGIAIEIGNCRAMDFINRPGIEFHVPGKGDHLSTGLRERFTHTKRLPLGQFVDMCQNQGADPLQVPATFKLRHPAPWPCQRGLRRLNRTINISRTPTCNLAQGRSI